MSSSDEARITRPSSWRTLEGEGSDMKYSKEDFALAQIIARMYDPAAIAHAIWAYRQQSLADDKRERDERQPKAGEGSK